MKIRKLFLFLLPMMLINSATFAAGLSNKVNHSKEIQKIYETQSKEFSRLIKYRYERINWNEKLHLNDGQKIHLKKIMNEERAKVAEQIKIIRSAYSEIEKIQKQDDEKIRNILTPQQQTKFDTIKYKEKKSQGIKPKEDKPSRKRISSH